MAATEVGITTTGSTYGVFDNNMYDFMSFFSGSAHFTIIDSYMSHYWSNRPTSPGEVYTTKRYKGDPIATNDPSRPGYKICEDYVDCGEDNSWFIIECQTAIPEHAGLGLPKWQMKFQFCGDTFDLEDPSDPTGVKYPKNHLLDRYVYTRMCPWGGWDKADVLPDFNPVIAPPTPTPYPSFENNKIYLGHGGSGDDHRIYLIASDGNLSFIVRRNQEAYDIMSLASFTGDVIPVLTGRSAIPRIIISSGVLIPTYGIGNGKWFCEQTYTSGNADYIANDLFGMGFYDENFVRRQEGFCIPSISKLIGLYGQSQPNLHASPNFKMDLFPYMPIPLTSKGLRFIIPTIKLGYGIGFSPIDNKNWLSLGDTHCVYIKWDGLTSLY